MYSTPSEQIEPGDPIFFYFIYRYVFYLSIYHCFFRAHEVTKFLNKTVNYQNSVPPKIAISLNINDKKGKVVSFSHQTSLRHIAQNKYQKYRNCMEKIRKIQEKVFYKKNHISQNSVVTPTFLCIFGCTTVFSRKYQKIRYD